MQADALGYALIPGAERPGVMEPLCSCLEMQGVEAKVFALKGFSGVPEDLQSIQFGEWTESLVKDIQDAFGNRRRLVLIGHSLGGIIASDAANSLLKLNADQIEQVFGICPGFGLRHWAVKLHSIAAWTGASGIGPVWLSQILTRAFYPSGRIPVHKWYLDACPREEREETKTLLEEFVYPWWPTAAMGVYLYGRSKAWHAAKLMAERLVLVDSEKDILCAPTPKWLRRIASSHLTVEGSHFLPLEKPEFIAQLVLQHV